MPTQPNWPHQFVWLLTDYLLYHIRVPNGLPFLSKMHPIHHLQSLPAPTNRHSGNFKQLNCPTGYYNDLATLLLAINDAAVRNIFSTNTPRKYQPSSLPIFFALYCILGLITFGIAVPSGLSLPIILMGSAYGHLLGIFMGPPTNIDQGLFAVLGAASLMAGSMRITVTLCAIILELTNNLLLLPTTMIILLMLFETASPKHLILYCTWKTLLSCMRILRNVTVGELVDVKPAVVSLHGIGKVASIAYVLKNTTQWFPSCGWWSSTTSRTGQWGNRTAWTDSKCTPHKSTEEVVVEREKKRGMEGERKFYLSRVGWERRKILKWRLWQVKKWNVGWPTSSHQYNSL